MPTKKPVNGAVDHTESNSDTGLKDNDEAVQAENGNAEEKPNGSDKNTKAEKKSSNANPVTDETANEDSKDSVLSKDSDSSALEHKNTNSFTTQKVTSEDSKNDSLVETVKDGDEDILITLNEDNDRATDNTDNIKSEETTPAEPVAPKDELVKQNDSANKENTDVEEEKKPLPTPAAKLPPPPKLTPAPGVIVQEKKSPQMPIINQTISLPIAGVPPGVPLAQQGNQLGYITTVGGQTVFIPISMSSFNSNTVINQVSVQQKATPKPTVQPVTQITQKDLQPKSSWEMIELMRWEIRNRIPDNWNWSVAFHSKKEELSTVTSFLQELGSDVVKEQVYKDIIQIQTKKKEAGELKEPEVDSLEKMKTVYENTKKKVEHLQLKTLQCEKCDFKTESQVIMEYHRDFPHYDPPWDINKGYMECSHCTYRTKVLAQFMFHMMDIHKRQAKFVEKDQYFQCSLCPLNANTKAKLERHQGKCVKHFKLHANLQPYYHDVNYCMKGCFYKQKKPVVVPKPPAQVKPAVPQKPALAMPTRQQTAATRQQTAQQPQVHRPPVTTAVRPPAVAPQQRPTVPAVRTPPITQPSVRPNRPNNKEMSVFEVCEMCGGYVKDRQALRIHFYYAHKVELPPSIFQREQPPLTCDVCKAPFWTTQGLTKHRTMKRHFTGLSANPANNTNSLGGNQSCFMCLRKVSNLFLHVEQTHGMTMKDLVLMKKCIICGITAIDRKSLEVHMSSQHGVLIKASDFINDKTSTQSKTTSPANSSGPKSGKNIGKINFCVFCVVQFPDNIQLTVHCMKKHATCKECGMVVPDASHLDKHNCMKANRRCYICGQSNMTPDSYAVHLKRHVKACKVNLENLSPEQIENAIEKLKREYKPAIISLDSDEDSEVEVVEDVDVGNQKKEQKESESKKGETKEQSKNKEDSKELSGKEGNANTEKKSEEGEKKEINDATEDKDKTENEEDKKDKCKGKKTEKSDIKSDKNDIVHVDSKEEVIDEDKLLANDEDSNASNNSLKRKKPDSEIDEEELLREDSETKRPKLETKSASKTHEDTDSVEIVEKEEDIEMETEESSQDVTDVKIDNL